MAPVRAAKRGANGAAVPSRPVLAAWVVGGDAIYTRRGNLALLASLILHAGVIPVLFAYIGARIWRKHAFIAGWIVAAVPAVGAALAATAVYIMTPKGLFNTNAISNNWHDASLTEFLRLCVQGIPQALMALAWVSAVGAIGAGIAVVHTKTKRDGQPKEGQLSSESAPCASSEEVSS